MRERWQGYERERRGWRSATSGGRMRVRGHDLARRRRALLSRHQETCNCSFMTRPEISKASENLLPMTTNSSCIHSTHDLHHERQPLHVLLKFTSPNDITAPSSISISKSDINR